jgi:hypothetical protein
MAINAIRTMQAKDVINARLASAYITVNGERYLLFQAKKLEAKYEKTKSEVDILGRVSKGHKATGGNGTGSMTIYYNTSRFTKMLKDYKDTGEDIYFDMQVTSSDPTSDAGEQTVILKDCNLDSAVIAAFDASGDWLEQDVDFTFEDWELPTEYTDLDGMF